ncbi:histidine phosphatase family protein [Ilumatobacter coccineus]|jgi:broad specificity phosphatase PhoE|uniref:Phosphoglycerate mutase family protein n=1 Tax=Ilumatobacter coccineus (strain NBRC 103263 / KCTC 29153 / YM16-304) TaxID=1313172 RepID=A0A6C7EBI4_ILUCY|nr:histidine phosphatase family protein [Ilumatobacter coccineus]BAN01998.1 phosphoglycerate mutase family protein [Ilumatobacter coccineus YM16-304]
MTITRLLLVRHGESTWNAVRRWQGQADPPLTERGEQQALDAVAALRGLGSFSFVATSTLQRARRTGELLAAGVGVDIAAPIESLAERAAGEWEGLTRVEINERYPGFLDHDRRPPGYEDDDAVVHRAGAALTDLARRHAGQSMLVVSHGGVINALERDRGEPWVRLDNLEGRWFEYADDRLAPVGERVHLRAADPDDEPVDRSYA